MKNIDIRTKLKEAGYSSRQVSVREKDSYIVTVHDPAISLLEIEELTNEFKHIERDRSGDFTSGNTLVIVSRNNDHPVSTDRIIEAVKKALKQALDTPGKDWIIPFNAAASRYFLSTNKESPGTDLYGPKAASINRKTGESITGPQFISTYSIDPQDKKYDDYEKKLNEFAEYIAKRIRENELDIEYIKRNINKNEVNA